MKFCQKCQTTKPKTEYYKNKNRSDGLQAYCKCCKSTEGKKYYANNPDLYKEKRVQTRYGITVSTYENLHGAQQGCCFICNKELSLWTDGKNEKAKIDHEHSTGKVRALLCHNCNVILGLAKENPTLLRAAADYLDIHKERHHSLHD